MAFTFDGPNKIIICTSGTVQIDMKDLYSRWKDWTQLTDNSKYIEAFLAIGGDPIDLINGIYITSYFFLLNDWKIRPQEANHTLNVINGVLVTDDQSDPFVNTSGSYVVRILYSQPVRTETVGLTVSKIREAIWEYSLDGSFTAEEVVRIMVSAIAAKSTNDGKTFRDLDDTKNRIVGTVDLDGNRTDVEYDAS